MKFNPDFNIKNLLKKVKKSKPESEERAEEAESTSAEKSGKLTDKIRDMFNYEPQKERVLNREDFKGAGDVYYASVSALYKVVERLLWVVLVIFIIFSLLTNYQEITYNNFFYLLRDFTTAADSESSNYQVLSYDSSNRQNFALYRGGLVSAAPSAVSVFTAGGRRTMRNNNDYYSPNVVTSDKYVLVYDTASASFSVYNSFSKVYNEKLDSPITDACFDSKGAFALATRKNDIKTEVFLYDKNIKLRGVVPDNRFIFDMALDSDSGRFAAVYYDEGVGVGATSLCIYDIESSKSAGLIKEITIDGEFPLACSFLEDGRIAVITDRSIKIYGKKYAEIESINFEDGHITAFEATERGAAAVVSSGVPKRIIAFDESGELLYDNEMGENISDVSICGDYIFLQSISGVTRLNGKKDELEFLPNDGGKMLIYGEDTAIVCGEARAEYLVFGKNN